MLRLLVRMIGSVFRSLSKNCKKPIHSIHKHKISSNGVANLCIDSRKWVYTQFSAKGRGGQNIQQYKDIVMPTCV